MGIGHKIRRLRQERNMSQEELADFLGIAQTTVSNLESDKTQPDFLMVDKICRIFDKTFDYFLEDRITINNHYEKIEGGNVVSSNFNGYFHSIPEEALRKIEERLSRLEEEIKDLRESLNKKL